MPAMSTRQSRGEAGGQPDRAPSGAQALLALLPAARAVEAYRSRFLAVGSEAARGGETSGAREV